MLVIVDAFTIFTKLYAANTTGTREACIALENYFDNYSLPRRKISDRGTCFTSNEFERFVSERNILHIKTSVASPQSNGQVERTNRDLRAMLSKITESFEHSDWASKLREVEFAINNNVHGSIGHSPSELLFGVEQRGKMVDELTEYIKAAYTENQRDLNEIRTEGYDAIKKSQSENVKKFNKHHKPAKLFPVGDLVVLKNIDTTPGIHKKLMPKYR